MGLTITANAPSSFKPDVFCVVKFLGLLAEDSVVVSPSLISAAAAAAAVDNAVVVMVDDGDNRGRPIL